MKKSKMPRFVPKPLDPRLEKPTVRRRTFVVDGLGMGSNAIAVRDIREEAVVVERPLERPRQRVWSSPKAVACVLCGRPVPEGDMVAHKLSQHGESATLPKTKRRLGKYRVLAVYRAGLPSLGRKK